MNKIREIIVHLVIVVCITNYALGQSCIPEDERIDCYLVDIPSQLGCQAKGCTWCESDTGPSCFLPPTYGYKLDGVPIYTPDGITYILRRSTNVTYYGHDFPIIVLELRFQSNYRLRAKFYEGGPRWEVPLTINLPSEGNTNLLYDVQVSDDPVFSFKVIRKSTGTVIFDTSLGGLTFAEQFLQISTRLPSKNLFGIGENEQSSYKHQFDERRVWPLYSRDQPPEGNTNMYGVHPHYTVVEDEAGNTHSVVFINSNAQEFTVVPTPAVVYKTIGGLLDFYIFMGPTPENTVQQYTEAVGRMDIPPYWSLGFQLCRFAYNTLEVLQETVNRTAQYEIPHDVQYVDKDLMDRDLDFTISEDRFGAISGFIKELHDRGMRFITIVDPGISNGEPAGSYLPYEEGNSYDVWIKKEDGTPVEGKVWPEAPVQYPDFSKESTTVWWTNQFLKFKQLIDFDGIWIDMNEPVNFASGDLFQGCEVNNLNSPPYTPMIRNRLLSDGTLCPDHVDSLSSQYDTHSMYGWFQAQATREAVLASRPGKRAFTLSRSTFLGSGKNTAHWLGDNFSKWSNLHTSIIGMLQFNTWGIPMVGADICGFIGDTTPELCLRWHQLGAFYPFSRNHNGASAPQDPGVFGEEIALIMKDALLIRYRFLPYLYTLFYYHNTRGDTVARALWHEFPNNQQALEVDTQFMWGSGIMICPVLEEGVRVIPIYFPRNAVWYELSTGIRVEDPTEDKPVLVDAPLEKVNVFLRGGVILPTQEPAINTNLSSQNPFELVISLDENSRAEGRLYFDDGDSADTVTNGNYYLAKYTYEDGELTTEIENDGYPPMSQLFLSSVKILGISEDTFYTKADLETNRKVSDDTPQQLLLNTATRVLQVQNVRLPMNYSFKIKLM